MNQFNVQHRFATGGQRDAGARRGRREVVSQWEQAVVFRHGRVVRTVGPGVYRFWAGGYRLRRVDMRPWVLHVPTQEVPTADGVTVKVTVAGHVRVVDPAASLIGAQDAVGSLYLAVQVALRELVASLSVEQLLAARADAALRLAAAVQRRSDRR